MRGTGLLEWLGGLPPTDVTVPTFHAWNVSLFDNKTSIYTLISLPSLESNYEISDRISSIRIKSVGAAEYALAFRVIKRERKLTIWSTENPILVFLCTKRRYRLQLRIQNEGPKRKPFIAPDTSPLHRWDQGVCDPGGIHAGPFAVCKADFVPKFFHLFTMPLETDRKLLRHNILPNISTEYYAKTE